MEIAGYKNEVYILAGTTPMTNATGAKVQGVDSSDWQDMADKLEVSQFGDTHKDFIGGQKDTTYSMSGYYDPADTNGQALLVAGDFVMVGIYPQGPTAAGRQVKALVESVGYSATAAGRQEFSASLQGCGAPVALPARP